MDRKLLAIAIAVRVSLVCYGIFHDKYFEVKYTDIDYVVFTNASHHTFNGGTPYQTPTYKYTPLLALILLPNIFVHVLFGKLLFCLFDIFVAMVMYRTMTKAMNYPANASDYVISICWLFNPFTITISSRGNAEALQIFLVVMALHHIMSNRLVLAGLFYGLSVHFKIYPFIYGVPFLFYLTRKHEDNGNKSFWKMLISLLTLKENYLFSLVSLVTFALVGMVMYTLFGYDFIEHTYLFHLSRVDTQHNFSFYFYILRRTQSTILGDVINRLAFIPQFGTVGFIGYMYHQQLPLAMFLQTFAFVTFNKVCTSQYFIWYIGLLPIAWVYLSLPRKKVLKMLVFWLLSQGIWLFFAYLYEFRKYEILFIVWLASLFFLLINVYILYQLARHTKPNVELNYKTD